MRPLRQPAEEKQLNNTTTIKKIKGAGFITCLFLCSVTWAQSTHDWIQHKSLSNAYKLAFNLQVQEARALLNEIKTPEQLYVASIADVLELLVTEDEVKFEKYEDAYDQRLDALEQLKPATAASLFALAELRLQWAFTYLKFGHELDAAWNIRQAYLAVQECKKKYPEFIPIQKSSGMLEIMLGSVPEKYQWIMGLLNMQGSIDKGLAELEQVRSKSPTLYFETTLVYYLFQGFVLQHTEQALQGLEKELLSQTDNRLALFLGASLAIKNSNSEQALTLLKKVNTHTPGVPIVYAGYQQGEVYLHKGEYDSSILMYTKFLDKYRGRNYVKDAHYKIGICYWLSGKPEKAKKAFERARIEGKETTEADKYAARSLAEQVYPHVKLSKLRYATDGGYYEKANTILSTITSDDLGSSKEKIELTYRKARLAHKTNSLQEAEKYYQETIAQQGEELWYFAPNACLQLGYLVLERNNIGQARQYFEKALRYKKHEYKNSIDSKAKSALAQVKKK